jgi:hypothetical protein
MWGEFWTAVILLPVVVLSTFLTRRFHEAWIEDDFWGFPTVICGTLGASATIGLVVTVGCFIYEMCKAF